MVTKRYDLTVSLQQYHVCIERFAQINSSAPVFLATIARNDGGILRYDDPPRHILEESEQAAIDRVSKELGAADDQERPAL